MVKKDESKYLTDVDCTHTREIGQDKKDKPAYATDDPTDTVAKKQEEMAKEAIKKFKSLN